MGEISAVVVAQEAIAETEQELPRGLEKNQEGSLTKCWGSFVSRREQ